MRSQTGRGENRLALETTNNVAFSSKYLQGRLFQDKDRCQEHIVPPSSVVGIPRLRHGSHPTDRAPATAPGRRHRHDLCRPPQTPKSISCCWSGAGSRPCSNNKSAPRNRAMHEEVGEEVGHNRQKRKEQQPSKPVCRSRLFAAPAAAESVLPKLPRDLTDAVSQSTIGRWRNKPLWSFLEDFTLSADLRPLTRQSSRTSVRPADLGAVVLLDIVESDPQIFQVTLVFVVCLVQEARTLVRSALFCKSAKPSASLCLRVLLKVSPGAGIALGKVHRGH